MMRKVFLILSVFVILCGTTAAQENEEVTRQNGERDSLLQAFAETRLAEEEGQTGESRYRQRTKLTANDGADNDYFGNSVAVSGNIAVVGARYADVGGNSGQGAAYVFVRSTAGVWNFTQKLTASDGAAGDFFGSSVAVAVTNVTLGQAVIMIAAVEDDIGANSNQGSVYVFARISANGNFSQQGKLTASDGAASNYFGASIAINSSFAVIGAFGANVGANAYQGAAYVFVRSGTAWVEEQKLTAWDGDHLDYFGSSVGISGTRAVIGAPNDNIDGNVDQGSVYVFERSPSGNTWLPQIKLRLSSAIGAPGDNLGFSVAVSGNTVIAGAPYNNNGANADQGAAYVWTGSGTSWSAPQTLRAADGGGFDHFGYSVALSGDTAIIGAPSTHSNPSIGGRGAAYFLNRSSTNFVQQQKLLAPDGEVGDHFGYSVAIGGESVIVGANGDDIGANEGQGSAYVFALGGATPFDFDGDGKTDIGIFRPSDGSWWYSRSADNQFRVFTFGQSTDLITPGDFTGDGKADVAIFRPSTGFWFVMRSEDNSFFSFPFGAAGDIPCPQDFDGDGRQDAAVFRPSSGTWFILNSNGSGTSIVQFGNSTDKPVPADFDGDGRADIAIFRPSDGSWWYLRSSDNQFRVFNFGTGTDKPVRGDFTGDGKADLAVWRPSTGFWYIQRSEDNSFYSVPFGASSDQVAPGDYDGDGKFDTAVFRPSTGEWFIQRSSAGMLIMTFGAGGDRPLANAFVP